MDTRQKITLFIILRNMADKVTEIVQFLLLTIDKVNKEEIVEIEEGMLASHGQLIDELFEREDKKLLKTKCGAEEILVVYGINNGSKLVMDLIKDAMTQAYERGEMC